MHYICKSCGKRVFCGVACTCTSNTAIPVALAIIALALIMWGLS